MIRFLCLVLLLILTAAYFRDVGTLAISEENASWLVAAGWLTLALIGLTLVWRLVSHIVRRVGQAMDQRDDSLAAKIGSEIRKPTA